MKLTKLEMKGGVHYFEGKPMTFKNWPFDNSLHKGNVWALHDTEGAFRGFWLAIHQCCTGLLVQFYVHEEEVTILKIGQFPIGIKEMGLATKQIDGRSPYFIASGSACNGEGIISLCSNLGNADWEWVNKVRG